MYFWPSDSSDSELVEIGVTSVPCTGKRVAPTGTPAPSTGVGVVDKDEVAEVEFCAAAAEPGDGVRAAVLTAAEAICSRPPLEINPPEGGTEPPPSLDAGS